MAATLRHTPHYTVGTWANEALGVYVGWAAQDNSPETPSESEQGNTFLFFSGEDFSQEQGAASLAGVAAQDPGFPRSLNGWFHGLLVDRATGAVKLFNDRYGIRRLYYHETKDAFYFAAETKAILAVRPELRSLDPRGLGEFISCGCVLENRTLFPGIQLLPCASAWTFRNGTLEQRATYFLPEEWEHQEVLEPEAYYRELRDVFARRVPRYFRCPSGVAMSLTGGLDTRMILAWHRPPSSSLRCYSFSGMYRDSHDVKIARRVAQVCGQPHEVIRVDRDFLSQFARYAERTVYLTDGCLSVRHAPDLYVNEKARAIAPVRMTGNYGGEVLRRIRAFKPVHPPAGLFNGGLLAHVQQARETYAGLLGGHPLSFAVFRQAPWHHYGLLALEQSQVTLRSPFLDNHFVQTVFRAPASAMTSNDISLRLIHEGNPELGRIPTDRGLTTQGGLRTALAKRLREFSFKAEFAYDYGMPQWLAQADRWLASLRPEQLFLGRHKFTHFRVWYRDVLASYVREMLLDSRSLARPYLKGSQVEAMVNGHLHGRENHTLAIHTLLTLELIHRTLLES